jgi:hypothetical protein
MAAPTQHEAEFQSCPVNAEAGRAGEPGKSARLVEASGRSAFTGFVRMMVSSRERTCHRQKSTISAPPP